MCLYVFRICCCFLCFKQKTAYELRISDWSSDVCSSDLDRANLKGANLEHATFNSSSLRGANLQEVNFADARLSNTDLSGADLRSCLLDGADMSGADLTDCVIASGMDKLAPDIRALVVAHFDWISSGGRKGTPASFAGRDLIGVNFFGAGLPAAAFTAANLGG